MIERAVGDYGPFFEPNNKERVQMAEKKRRRGWVKWGVAVLLVLFLITRRRITDVRTGRDFRRPNRFPV